MKGPITYILLLVILCLWYQVQTTTGKKCSCPKGKNCPPWYIRLCIAATKRSDIDDDVTQKTDLRADEEKSDIQVARGRTEGGESESDGYRGSREGDDELRSDFNDLRRQLSDEVELVDIGNRRRGHSARSAQLDSAIDRLRSLLGTTDLQDVDDRGEEEEEKREERIQEEEEEESQEQSNTDIDKGCISNETQILLKEILADIESRFDTQPTNNSKSEN